MTDKDFNAVFSKRLKYYLNKNDMTQKELAKILGVGTTSVYNWVNGIKSPRMDKVDAMCSLFNCRRSDFLKEDDDDTDTSYYLDEKTKKIAQEIYENKELGLLFDAARTAKPEDLETVHTMLTALKRKEKGDEY